MRTVKPRLLSGTIAEVHALGRRLKPGPLPAALVAKLREVERLQRERINRGR